MKSNYSPYDPETSFKRLDQILDDSYTYTEVDEIPSRDKLQYNNGFYVKCGAIFVDIRGSSALPSKYRNPTLARIYKSYISELVAIMNGSQNCKEVNIVGDCVSGIFEARSREDSFHMVVIAQQINTLVQVLNHKLKKKKLEPINIGIGIAKGRALMTLAGFNGSGIKDVIWMGKVVNQASNLCGTANKNRKVIVISEEVYKDLAAITDQTMNARRFFSRCINGFDGAYHGALVDPDVHQWLVQERRKTTLGRLL